MKVNYFCTYFFYFYFYQAVQVKPFCPTRTVDEMHVEQKDAPGRL